MKYRDRATETFWENFYRLAPSQKESAREAWEIFKQNPFDARLRSHKIHRLSSIMKRTVHAVVIEGDLRVVFYVEADTIVSFNIGTHAIYSA
jgi:mRNA-degrading endonuclease YafQ of YafQ-DinJ toxin-antitoxin module